MPPPPPAVAKASGSGRFDDFPEGELTLQQFCQRMAQPKAIDAIREQYKHIVEQDKLEQPCTAQTANRGCNRYNDIKCYDHSRVVIRKILPDSKPVRDYINANWMPGYGESQKRRFICCQVVDFWRMCWQEDANVIVSLTKLGGPKCVMYLPSSQTCNLKCGEFVIENRGVTHQKNFDATSVRLTLDTGSNGKSSELSVFRRMLHLTYYAWPDKGTPDSSTNLLNFLKQMEYNRAFLRQDNMARNAVVGDEPGPIIVHCSAGVGRTGTLVALDTACKQMEMTNETGPATVDLYNTVLRMRRARGWMVQRPEQYIFLHMAVLEHSVRKRYGDPTALNVEQFYRKVKETCRQDEEEN